MTKIIGKFGEKDRKMSPINIYSPILTKIFSSSFSHDFLTIFVSAEMK